jgi:hypothetical protein
MARTSVEVPAPLVGVVRETVVLLYHSTVEALHFALRACLDDGPDPSEEAMRGRDRLAELDALLVRLGWWGGAATTGSVTLTASREVLHDALYGSLIEAGDRLAAACGDGRGSRAVRAAAMEVIALDGLLAEVREG